MKKVLLHIVFCFALVLNTQAQDTNGVTSFSLPVRNSITFNKYTINPTFSFVRAQYKYASFTNKKQWVQFNDAPQTYLFSYAGRLNENMGFGVGVFQQNIGVLNTFGGVLNYAYNVVLDRDSNLTFGANLGFYNSGINESKIVVNTTDPALANLNSSLLLTFNPGINYGTTFFDFGVALNNFALYNFSTSNLVEDDSEKGIQAHIMYTGFLQSRGFFDEAKFSGLLRSEFLKDNTILSGVLMLTVPKGIWAQIGYNTLYGASGGIGLNITTEIAIEYNFEKALGDLIDFGPSHEITLAYRFKNKNRYQYSDAVELASIIPKSKVKNKTTAVSRANIAARAKLAAEEKANNALAEADKKEEKKPIAASSETLKVKEDSIAKVKIELDRKLSAEKEASAKIVSDLEKEVKAKEVKRIAKKKAKDSAEAKAKEAKIIAETKLRVEAQDRLLLEAKKTAQEAQLRKEAQEKARIEAEAKIAEQAQNRKEIEENARVTAEVKATQEEQLRILAQKKIEEEKEKLEAKQKESEAKRVADSLAQSIENLKANARETIQQQVLNRIKNTIADRAQDLKDLKEENDLGDKGIFKAPKPFKSISSQKAELSVLKVDIDNLIKSQDLKINELKELLKNTSNSQDSIATIYLDEITILQSVKKETERSRLAMDKELKQIQIATDFERKRRIKRAAYDDQDDRYKKDMAALNRIKQTTEVSSELLTPQDFDFGEDQGTNIKILKNVKQTESGYYIVLAVHNDVEKRDKFLKQAVASGQTNIKFFFDLNTSNYYIYHEKFDTINSATKASQSTDTKAYSSKKSIIKIEN